MNCGSIFREKDSRSRAQGGTRVQGVMTRHGRARFEVARRSLAVLYRELTGESITRVSDGDVVEFLSRGLEDTERYIRKLNAEKSS